MSHLKLLYQQVILLLLAVFSIAISAVENDMITDGATHIKTFDLKINLVLLNPDCHNQSFYHLVINDQFPGPALHVVKNDVVKIRVTNDALNNQSSSIHFHGIRQYGTSFSDGVAQITQLPMLPGETFIQEFQVLNQTGTFYYHAHVGVQDDTIQGPFIVHETQASYLAATSPKMMHKEMITEGCSTYHEERILQWTEYWHQSFIDRQDYYLSPRFTNDNGPDSILLNGKTIYNNHTASENCQGLTTIDVEANKVYRLRFIGSLTFRILGIFIQDHNMTLIEIDGEYVKPYPLEKYVEISAGQRMSVLIKTGNYSSGTLFPIASNYRWRTATGYTQNGYGYLRYVDSDYLIDNNNGILTMPSTAELPPNLFPSVDTPGWVLNQVSPWKVTERDQSIIDAVADKTLKLSMTEIIELDQTTRYRNNNRTQIPWGSASASLLDQIISNTLGSVGVLDNTDGFSIAHQTYPLAYGQVIDLVFQNNMLPTGLCVAHPWHTHGHSHYLLAEGVGDYVHEKDGDIRTFKSPLLKDVSITYPGVVNGTIPCGWTKVRIFTDNPGVWAVHCHITAHMLQGKMVVLEVASDMILATRRVFKQGEQHTSVT